MKFIRECLAVDADAAGQVYWNEIMALRRDRLLHFSPDIDDANGLNNHYIYKN